MVEWPTTDQEIRGPISKSVDIFSIYLNEELDQKVNNKKKKKKKNNNSSNSLVFGRWPLTKISIAVLLYLLVWLQSQRSHTNWLDSFYLISPALYQMNREPKRQMFLWQAVNEAGLKSEGNRFCESFCCCTEIDFTSAVAATVERESGRECMCVSVSNFVLKRKSERACVETER